MRVAVGVRMRRELLACAALALATVVVYAPVRNFPFISYDDPIYVTENPHLAEGFTTNSLRWILWNDYSDNWFPLTWLSHLLDVELFGLRPGPPHVVSALLHAANAALLFVLLRYATGAYWPSVIASALFALHPLRVESVAWVSERKDVLSGLFFLLTLIAYVWYARRRTAARYGVVALAYAAALMSKPMVVTLPFVLLLLDYWPLRLPRERWRAAVAEKAPLLAMAIAVCVATIVVQRQVGAVKGADRYSMTQRLGNAAVAYVSYVEKNLIPTRLSIFYPHPGTWPTGKVIAATIALAGATWLAWRVRATAPYVFTGWFWFVGMLVPVIGIVQVGEQSMADRYTYLPSIGLIVALVWSAAANLPRTHAPHRATLAAMGAGAAIAGGLAIGTARQLQHWEGGTVTLFLQAADVTSENWLAHRHLGTALAEAAQYDAAAYHLGEALRLRPTSAQTHFNYGNLLARQQRYREAADAYREATELDAKFAAAHNSLGAALAAVKDLSQAQAAFREAIAVNPRYPEAHANLGKALALQGRHHEAVEHFRRALELKPDFTMAQEGLARSLAAERPERRGHE